MRIEDLAEEYHESRVTRGLVVELEEVQQCAVEAARFYAAYGDISSLSGSSIKLQSAPGVDTEPPSTADDAYAGALPIRDSQLVNEGTALTVGEWAVIRPLFMLYVERENAMRIEATRTLGVEGWGRTMSEIAADIERMESPEGLPARAAIEPMIEV